MFKNILNALNIGVMPKWLLVHLFLMAFVLGGMNALFFTTAFAGFLAAHDLTFYPQIIVFSGIAGILLFNLYKYLFKTVTPRKAFLVFGCVFVLMILAAEIFPLLSSIFSRPVMRLAIWLPVTVIAEHLFYKATVNATMITEKQNFKRFLESAVILGTVVFSLVFTLLSTSRILVPFTTMTLGCLLFLMLDYYFVFRHFEYKKERNEDEPVDSLIFLLSEIPLKNTVLKIVFFSFLSIITFVFMEFSFLSAIDKMYVDRFQFTQFLSFFLAVAMMVNLLFKLFVYQNLIKTFRINSALQLSPLVMVLLLSAINVLMILPGYDNLASPYSMVFLCVVFGRFFSFLLRESFEYYSLKLFFSAIETYTSRLISGFLNLLLHFWAFIFGGLLLLLANSLEFTSLHFILMVNAGFAFVWLIVSIALSKNFSITIFNTIKKLTREYQVSDQDKIKGFKDRIMVSTNLSGMRYLLNYQRTFQPNHFKKTIDSLPENVQSRLEVIHGTVFSQLSKQEKWKEASFSSYDSDETSKLTNVELLAVSSKIKDRIRAVKMIDFFHDPRYYGILKMLLRDPDDEVRRNAIGCVATNYNGSIIQEIMEYIGHENFSDLASDVLISIGDNAMYPLIGLFQKSAIDTRTQIRIIRIMGKIATETTQQFLYSKLEYPNKWIVLEVVNSLIEKKHLVVDGETAFIDKAIYSTIGASAWLLAMTVSLEDLNNQSPVKRALDEEYQVTLDLLFKLLQLKYSEGVIQQVREYVMSDSANEQRELGVEMLSFVVEEEIKKYLFPLLHNNRNREKVLQLQELYPIQQKEAIVALREIINSDLGIVSLWTKACALSVYIEMSDVSVSEDVYAQVFHPEPLLSEIAFFGIYKWNRKVSLELFERLPNHRKKKLKAIMDKGVHHSYKTLFHKVVCLQKVSYFEKIKGHHLIPLAEVLNEHFLEAGGSAFVRCSEEEVLPVFMVPFGEVVLIDLHKRKYKLNRDNIYGLGLYAGTLTLSAFTDSVIYMVRPEQVGSLVLNHEDLSDALYQYIQKSNFY